MQHQTTAPSTPPSRKKFLLLTAAAFCSATLLRFITRGKRKESTTVKMLTEDGRLVEIDKTLLAPRGKKITDNELQQWVKKSSDQHKN